jgi:glycosyltransferase involved in cell wall biosynthesis
MSLHGVPVAKVEPSLDRSVFNADRPKRKGAGVTVAAMVRPHTPRRRPNATLEALSTLHAELGPDATIMTFGCDAGELDAIGGGGWRHLHHLGLLRPDEVAEHMRRCDVFIDASAYQGFGRGGLEAMACGAVPVLPLLGGVHEYAVHDHNAIVMEEDIPSSIAEAVLSLLGDQARLRRLQKAGIESTAGFSIDRAARSQLELFTALLASREAAARAS